jgi:hypothetical protein
MVNFRFSVGWMTPARDDTPDAAVMVGQGAPELARRKLGYRSLCCPSFNLSASAPIANLLMSDSDSQRPAPPASAVNIAGLGSSALDT